MRFDLLVTGKKVVNDTYFALPGRGVSWLHVFSPVMFSRWRDTACQMNLHNLSSAWRGQGEIESCSKL